MSQARSHSMYALTDSEIEKDKYGNWTGPPAKGGGKVTAVRTNKKLGEDWRTAKKDKAMNKEKEKDRD